MTRRGLVTPGGARIGTRIVAVLTLALAVGLAVAVSPFASSAPDGLNRVAEDKGFAATGRVAAVQEGAPISGYALPGVKDKRLATGLAGFLGALGVFAAGYGLALVAARGRGAPASRSASTPSP